MEDVICFDVVGLTFAEMRHTRCVRRIPFLLIDRLGSDDDA
jgi:hypothetical protein